MFLNAAGSMGISSCTYVYSASASGDIVLPERSAATVLMQSAKELKWPEMNFKTAEEYQGRNGYKQLHDDIIRFLQSKRLSFVGGLPSHIGQGVCEDASGCLTCSAAPLAYSTDKKCYLCSALFFISAGKSV